MIFLLILTLLVALAMIAVILLQRSEGGGLGMGGGGGASAFMTGRGAANLLTRATAVLAFLFMGLCLLMAVLNRGGSLGEKDILSTPPAPVSPPSKTAKTS